MESIEHDREYKQRQGTLVRPAKILIHSHLNLIKIAWLSDYPRHTCPANAAQCAQPRPSAAGRRKLSQSWFVAPK